MPNVSRSIVKRLNAVVAEIEAAAYARGRADARKELLDVLAPGGERRDRGSRGRRAGKPAPAKRRARGGKRAPRGSVPRFVERILRERPGSTVREILERASTDAERSIKQSSIRVELRNGRGQGKYAVNDRRWSLVESAPAGGGQGTSSEASPPSEPDPGESRGTLGLTW